MSGQFGTLYIYPQKYYEALKFSTLQKNSFISLINKIVDGYRPEFTESVTEKMRQLLSKCWSDNPEERPTFKEIFDALSSDVTAFFSEKVDQTEIQNFLNQLNESKNNQENKIGQKEVDN